MLATLKYRDFCSILIQYTRNNYNNDTYFCRSNLATIWEYFAIYIFWGIDTLGVIYSISTADNDVILTLATFFAAKYSPYTNTWSTHNNYSKCPQSRHTGNGKPLQYTASLIYTYMASPHTFGTIYRGKSLGLQDYAFNVATYSSYKPYSTYMHNGMNTAHDYNELGSFCGRLWDHAWCPPCVQISNSPYLSY